MVSAATGAQWALLLLTLGLQTAMGSFAKQFFINWNTSNEIFRIDNTNHIFDMNTGNQDFEFDQVNIVCPTYPPNTEDHLMEKYFIYNVSREEYETCRITNANPRVIAVCNQPLKLLYFTITFRPFSPQPGGLEFFPGRDYYFISTSSKDDLHRRIGGRCLSHNMKLIFRVCCKVEERTTSAPYTPPTVPPPPPPPPQAPKPTLPPLKPATKKTHNPKHDKAPNEVVKSEELSYSRSNKSSLLPFLLPAFLVLLLPRIILMVPAR